MGMSQSSRSLDIMDMSSRAIKQKAEYTPVNQFVFMDSFESSSTNGLLFNDIYVPEEVVSIILSFVPPDELLRLSLVCKTWCNLIKSDIVWMSIYERTHQNKAKNLPWYVYYCYYTTNNFKNLLKNGNGEKKYEHWSIVRNMGDGFRIENPPAGSDPLPEGTEDFNGQKSCFSTSFFECVKFQDIIIGEKRLLQFILRQFKPHIYASEWVAGRFDCGCIYNLVVEGFQVQDMDAMEEDDIEVEPVFKAENEYMVEQWNGKKWEKVEVIIRDYSEGLHKIRFQHTGRDTQFWKGHYGSKMAGGVVKFLFDTIEPLINCDEVV